MTPENVLDHPALVADQRAWTWSFEDGFLTVPGYVSPAWLVTGMTVAFDRRGEARSSSF